MSNDAMNIRNISVAYKKWCTKDRAQDLTLNGVETNEFMLIEYVDIIMDNA